MAATRDLKSRDLQKSYWFESSYRHQFIMKLFTLFFGKSKKRMKAIMTDTRHKCENYRDARGARMGGGWHDIQPAKEGSVVWRQKSSTVKGSRHDTSNCRGGYISKNGFNANT